MAYFNGGLHGWNSPNGYVPPEPCTKVYCDKCADGGAVPMDQSKPKGQQHWDTGFRWAPVYGSKCHQCSVSA